MRKVARHLMLLAVIGASIVTPAMSPAHGKPTQSDRPCGRVAFDYSLDRPVAGQLMDMDLSIVNCSDHEERLRLHVKASGPCPFAHPVATTYTLPPDFGVSSSALIIAPSCFGRYSVHVKLTIAGSRRVLDVAGDGFFLTRG
jgi:hypothetical protein